MENQLQMTKGATMNELQIFNNNQFGEIRTILKRICDVVFKKKKTQDEVPEFEDFPDMNDDGEDIAG